MAPCSRMMMSGCVKDKATAMKGPRDRDRGRLRTLVWICTNSSCRLKLLVGLMVLFFTLLLTSRAASIVGLHHHQPQLLALRHRYTVLINTWKRYDILKKSVAHYASCHGVDAIRVVWSEKEAPSDSLQSALYQSVMSKKTGHTLDLRIDTNEVDDLNNRFRPLDGVATDAIFSVDDDVLVPCSRLEFGFRVWLSAPNNMVGFVPRMHWASRSKKNWKQISPTYRSEQLTYRYGGWWSVWWMGSYSMVLTKAAFLHHKYFDYYTYEMPAAIRDYVASERNCEDVAMSFMVANLTTAPPIWVKGKLYEIGSSGISSLKGHNQRRTVCLNYLTAMYGYMPLVSSNVKAVDANLEWLW